MKNVIDKQPQTNRHQFATFSANDFAAIECPTIKHIINDLPKQDKTKMVEIAWRRDWGRRV